MSRHRFTIMVEIDDLALEKDGRLDDPWDWDVQDLKEALGVQRIDLNPGPVAVMTEVDDHEVFVDD